MEGEPRPLHFDELRGEPVLEPQDPSERRWPTRPGAVVVSPGPQLGEIRLRKSAASAVRPAKPSGRATRAKLAAAVEKCRANVTPARRAERVAKIQGGKGRARRERWKARASRLRAAENNATSA